MTENVKVLIALSSCIVPVLSMSFLIEYVVGLRENKKTSIYKFTLEPNVDVKTILTTRMIDGDIIINIEYYIYVDGKEKLRPPQSLKESICSDKFSRNILQREFIKSLENISNYEARVEYEIECYNKALKTLIDSYKPYVEKIRKHNMAIANQKKLRKAL